MDPINLTNLEKDMAALKTDLAVVRSNYLTREDLAVLRTDVAKEIGAFRADVAKEIGGFRADVAKEIGAVRADLAKMESTLLKWFIGTAIALAGASFAAARLIN